MTIRNFLKFFKFFKPIKITNKTKDLLVDFGVNLAESLLKNSAGGSADGSGGNLVGSEKDFLNNYSINTCNANNNNFGDSDNNQVMEKKTNESPKI